jgi:hypothetical protein
MKKVFLAAALVVAALPGCGQRDESDVMRQSEDVVAEARKEYDAEQEAVKQSSADAAPAVSLADEFADAYTHAEATLRQAREMKYSWTTTAPLLKAASEAAESGDYEKGMSLVTEALLQAELAIGQATEQGTAWKQAVVQ